MLRPHPGVVLLLCSCTAPNPLFGDGADATGKGETTTASTAVTDDTVDPTGVDGSSGRTSDSGESTARPEDTSTGTVASTTETGTACTLPEVGALVIEPSEANLAIDPICPTSWSSPQGMLTVEGSSIGVTACGCPCMSEPLPDHSVEVVGAEIPAFPACGHLVAWTKPTDDGCAWAGVAVFAGGSQPSWIASNAEFVPTSVFGGFALGLAEDEPCPSDACADAGSHALVFDGVQGDNTITMDEPPKVMDLPLFSVLPYLVDNVVAVTDEACRRHLGWTATFAG